MTKKDSKINAHARTVMPPSRCAGFCQRVPRPAKRPRSDQNVHSQSLVCARACRYVIVPVMVGMMVGSMQRALQRLSSLAVERAKAAGYFHDGGGLYLQVTATGGKSWTYRFSLGGRRRDMGLGPYPAVSLAAARKAASEARSLVKAGQDPIAAREAERARKRIESARGLTFDQAAKQFLEGHEATDRKSVV